MTMKRLTVLGITGALVAVAGCMGVQLTAEDNGTTVTIAVSGRLTVNLASNPTTGFQWALVELDTAVVENTAQRYVPTLTLPGMVGSGGTEVWEFTGVAEGTTTLRLEYRRPWETEEDPAYTFEVTVTVGAAQ